MHLPRMVSIIQSDAPAVPIWAISLIAGFVFAALALLTLQSPINHLGLIDPIIYEAYIHNYKEVLRLYGYTYYSTRIAWIFPAFAANILFGNIPGYFIIRIALLGASATAFGILVGRFCRWQLVLYAVVWYCFFPLILRSFADDYVAGAAIAYSTIAVACVLTAQPRAHLQHAIGGVLFALALNAYPASFIVTLSIVPAWLLIRKAIRFEINFENLLSAAAGFIATYFAIWLALRIQFAQAGKTFELFPVSTVSSLASGGASVWFASLAQIFLKAGEYFRLYPVFLLIGLTAALFGYRRKYPVSKAEQYEWSLAAVFAVICASVVAIYLFLHFGLSGGAIYVPWGYLFSIPTAGLAGFFFLGIVTPRKYTVLICVGGILISLLTMSPDFLSLLFSVPKILWLVLGLAMSCGGLIVTLPALRKFWLVPAAASMLLPLGFYTSAYSEGPVKFGQGHEHWVVGAHVTAMRQADRLGAEDDLRRGTLQLMDDVNSQVPPGQPPGLWYANKTGFADEVGSAFLWKYSRVASTEAGDPGMPRINEFSEKRIQNYTYLVLIGRTQAEVQAGQRALITDGLTVRPILERQVGGRDLSFVYRIVRKTGPAPDTPR